MPALPRLFLSDPGQSGASASRSSRGASRPFGGRLPAGLTVRMCWTSFDVFGRFSLSRGGHDVPSRYSGSAVIPTERAPKAAFRPPPRRRRLSPVAYGGDLPTVGRRGISPVRLQTIFSRRRRVSPRRPATDQPCRSVAKGSSGWTLGASARGGAWHADKAENAVSRSLSAWLLRDRAFSGPPGGTALASYPRRQRARFERRVPYEHGPARVGFSECSLSLLPLASPFVPR